MRASPNFYASGGTDVSFGAGPRFGNVVAPSTATEAAYGNNAAVQPSAGLHPATPTGLAVWAGVGAFALLVLIYRSLPG